MAEYHVRPEAPQRVDGGKAPWDDGVVNEDVIFEWRSIMFAQKHRREWMVARLHGMTGL